MARERHLEEVLAEREEKYEEAFDLMQEHIQELEARVKSPKRFKPENRQIESRNSFGDDDPPVNEEEQSPHLYHLDIATQF